MGTMREELDFYMNEAEPELLEERREYIEVALMNILSKRLDSMNERSTDYAIEPESVELKNMYQEGLDFL
ncbi:hypothetical protein [Xenorhabdus miraniensis]|uniref:Uncharacterized protein n=1 Tax=Xenorhabdus miraniensis TaxID=351674 RepID=A0A2D0JJX3_9GAMM|nr:hypothetical protein [Xenorhabdus miraniensis]PHM46551.1 hypothetical protein Xmir_04116 [Xenorhabdus miraniensis]